MLDPKRKLFRWGPISACPLFMYFTVEPAFAPLRNLLGICYPKSTVIFYDNKVLWLLDDEETMKASKRFTEKITFNKKNRKRYFSLWKERTDKLVNIFHKLDKVNFLRVSQIKLVELYEDFAKIYYDWWALTISVELGTISLVPQLGNQLKKYYKDQKEYNLIFSVLTSPLVLTFYREEQKDLLKILNLPKSKQQTALKVHQKKYYWIYNSYLKGKILDLDYFKTELKKLQKTDHQKTLKEIKNYSQDINNQKKQIYLQLRPAKDFLELVSLVEQFSTLQDERKMNNFKAEHYLELFVMRFSEVTKLDTTNLKLLVLDELSSTLKNIDNQLIQNRKSYFVVNCTDKEISHYEGQKALSVAKQFIDLPDINQNIIQGVVASVGEQHHFRGTARIVLTIDQIEKIREGDILVTTMTSPDFVIGMKKAQAIITDTGGMLSHAAIVSRELKKPCIVGTEIATKVIHDGDILELHSGKGVIKIIKS